jgi:lysozyme
MGIFEQLKRDEGWKHHIYVDTVGKHSIGCGRNLDDVGLSDEEIQHLLENDVAHARMSLDRNLGWWHSLSDARQGVLLNLCFNLGVVRLLGFHNMLTALQAGDYAGASGQLLNSAYAHQVGDRAVRLARQLETDQWQ